MKSLSRKVDSFDGQTITVDGKPCYELGGFLGGGAAGVVYEVRSHCFLRVTFDLSLTPSLCLRVGSLTGLWPCDGLEDGLPGTKALGHEDKSIPSQG